MKGLPRLPKEDPGRRAARCARVGGGAEGWGRAHAGPSRGRAGGAPGRGSERRPGGSSRNRLGFSPASAVPGGQHTWPGRLERGRQGIPLAQTFCPGGSGASGARPFGRVVPVARRVRLEARGRIHSRARSLVRVHPRSTGTARGPRPVRERTRERRLEPGDVGTRSVPERPWDACRISCGVEGVPGSLELRPPPASAGSCGVGRNSSVTAF